MNSKNSRNRRRARTAGVALVLVVLSSIVACGSDNRSDGADDGSTTVAASTDAGTAEGPTRSRGAVGEDAQAYVDALVATFDEDDPDEQLYTEEQVNCLAEGVVDVIGLDALQDAGLSPAEFADNGADDFPAELGVDEDKANELYDTFAGCDIDLQSVLASTGGSNLTDEQQACLDEILTEENLRTFFVASFTGDELAEDPLDGATDCLGFEDTGTGQGTPTTGR